MAQTYYRKGFGLKRQIEGDLAKDYHSQLVDRIREGGHVLEVDDLTFRLAKEFGFCYGVDRAVEYAYESRTKFPDKRIHLVGEIIHNPHVNEKLEAMGVTIIRPGDDGQFDFSSVRPEDVVLIPAFGLRYADFQHLRGLGCVLVDTTCGSVLNVWKRVEQYARDGFTAVVHGKYFHEETKATTSQVTKHEGGRYIIVRDMGETELLCRFIQGEATVAQMQEAFGHKVSDGFDFARDLIRMGVANQTTMLASESLAIAERIAEALTERFGAAHLETHFRTFDTICSATQERQDAILELIEEPLDAMIVIGGYNSSNTNHLAKICTKKVTTYHISDSKCILPESGAVRYKPVDGTEEVQREDWLEGVKRIGITAGASTPNNKIGEAIERILETKGLVVPAQR
ncbi:MAG: 4-hydroxy-3-methylbut-2-enyl diphosphate reductase [Gemmatimonadota bacterium]|nr:MAG: 4-hydroxy-3-methylbut-2-enyl diphosphate reductase [Gemmatimonadota bacterium]